MFQPINQVQENHQNLRNIRSLITLNLGDFKGLRIEKLQRESETVVAIRDQQLCINNYAWVWSLLTDTLFNKLKLKFEAFRLYVVK